MSKKALCPGLLLFILIPAGAAAQPTAQKDVQSLLSAFMAYTDCRIRSAQQSLQILASTDEAKSGEWKNFEDLLRTFQELDDGFVTWYVLPDGTYYTAEQGRMEMKLNERNYFPGLMKGRNVTGALVVSTSTGRRSAVIAVPVMQDGQVVAAVGASLFLDRLAEKISTILELRPDTTFFALAPNGLTTLHSRTDRHFLDPRELGSETLRNAANEMLAGTQGEVTYEFDNSLKRALYRTSPLTQWKFTLTSSSPARQEEHQDKASMTTFILTGRYSAEAIEAISAERTKKAHEIVGQSGGKIVAAYATMGDQDLVAIVQFPGVSDAMKAAVELSQATGISFSTVPALEMEAFDKLLGGTDR